MATNFVIARAGAGKIGAVGAAEGACVDVGSIRKCTFTFEQDVFDATDASSNDMIVEQALGPAKCTLSLELEEITAANVAKALGITDPADGTLPFTASAGAPAYYCGYFHGFKLNGDAKTLHVCKLAVKPGSSISVGGNEQQILTLECTLLVDPDSAYAYDVFGFIADTADTTAPTISSISPADAATNVSKAATTVVAVTFSEAVRTEDLTAASFFVHADDGAVKAGTISLGTNNTVATFTPTTAWAATTKYHVVVAKGIRDTAGNKLAATSVTDFTTGS